MMPAMAFARSIPTPRNTLTAWHSRTTATAAHPGRLYRRASMHHAADLHLRCAHRPEALTTPELHTSGDLRTAAISARAAATTSPSLNCRAAQLTPWPSMTNTSAPTRCRPQGLVSPHRLLPRRSSPDRRSLLPFLVSAALGVQLPPAPITGRDAATQPPPETAADAPPPAFARSPMRRTQANTAATRRRRNLSREGPPTWRLVADPAPRPPDPAAEASDPATPTPRRALGGEPLHRLPWPRPPRRRSRRWVAPPPPSSRATQTSGGWFRRRRGEGERGKGVAAAAGDGEPPVSP